MSNQINEIIESSLNTLTAENKLSIRRMLTKTGPDQSARVGRVLQSLSLENWFQPDVSEGEVRPSPKRIAIISNFTCDEIQHHLRTILMAKDIYPEIYVAPYNQYIEEVLNPQSDLYHFKPDVLLCLIDEHIVTDSLQTPWTVEQIESNLTQLSTRLDSLFNTYLSRQSALVVVNTIPLAKGLLNQLIDYKSKNLFSLYWRQFNNRILEMNSDQLVIIDTDALLQHRSVNQLRDERLSRYAKMHMSESLLNRIAIELSTIVMNMVGKTKKGLVLDLDNTLWGGILGDDGIAGINLGYGAEGEAFVNFQQALKQIQSQGILLTVCSKNNSDIVLQALHEHTDMVIKKQDLSWICANWEPKHINIQNIAKGLNIGLDSLVFVDDSAFERDSVSHYLPKVEVLDLPLSVENYLECLLDGGYFNCLKLSQEDYSRTEKYQREQERKEFFTQFESMEDYLHGLALSVDLFLADEASIPRISQLTQRTNQFNMTTQRLSTSEVSEAIADNNQRVFGIRCRDKFGDNGIVGAVLLDNLNSPSTAPVFSNFILSCRVFSRGIETAVLEAVLLWLKQSGYQEALGHYIASSKNQKVASFYLNNGFESMGDIRPGFARHNLAKMTPSCDWISLNSSFEHKTEETSPVHS